MEPRHADVLLVGGGVAAARCARTLRRGGFSGSILLVGEEDLPPYNRPPLSKELLRNELPDELVLAEPAAWYARRGVELVLGVPAASLDPVERVVELADGRRLAYGACLLAMGAAPRPAPVPAYLLRTLADARRIGAAAVPGSRAVVIGGGFIGVEVGASLAARELGVTLLCGSDLLWGGAFGEGVSRWAAERLGAVGIEVRCGAMVFGPADLPAADLVVAGVGVEPRVELAVPAGLAVDDGILADERQATSAPSVLAAGDVARSHGRPRVEHWHAARESGERAALAILGQPVPPPPAPWIFSEFADAKLDVIGWGSDGEWLALTPSVHATVDEGIVSMVAILDGAVAVDPVRRLVGLGAGLGELEALVR
jgi:3-phenylpropionate/trans-cinnamate dioxygenase ferredoxin reductase subunit